jgi:predicted RNA-binding protein YlxR (DUF448 family)
LPSAVRSLTAFQSGQCGQIVDHGTTVSHEGRVRTCVGCRKRAAAAELLRVVVAPGAIGTADPGLVAQDDSLSCDEPAAVSIVPDPRHRAPGRGAWLHYDPACVELAERRRAFARALRVPGMVDSSPVREYVAVQAGIHPVQPVQELTSNGHSMKRQQ